MDNSNELLFKMQQKIDLLQSKLDQVLKYQNLNPSADTNPTQCTKNNIFPQTITSKKFYIYITNLYQHIDLNTKRVEYNIHNQDSFSSVLHQSPEVISK